MKKEDQKTVKNFEDFLDAMDHLYESISSVRYEDAHLIASDEWGNLARKCEKLASEIDKISERLEEVNYET